MTSTLLVLTGIGIPDYSARGLDQTLEPIDATSQLRRSVNGDLIDLSNTALRKFKSTITCTDMDAPAVNGIWPGQSVTVDCVAELAYPTSGGSPDRPVVAGSSRVEGAFTFYRPQLTMLVASWRTTFDEWGAETGWRMELEEV